MSGSSSSAFNPLHHTGGDYTAYQFKAPGRSFQSTPPHRWRPDYYPGTFSGYFLSIHSTTQVETRRYFYQALSLLLSIHSTTQVETAISYNIIQDFLLISNKLTIISYIYHQFLLHILSITIPFCIFFWCESPWNFMFA